ncbi:MAG: NAD-dependent epimerase/dehydratase family protein [Pseudomonadota bacterium]
MALVSSSDWHQLPVAVTGASGFVGRQLVNDLLAFGVPLRAAIHHRSPANIRVPSYSLDLVSRRIEDGFLTGARVLVHLAGPAHTYGVDDTYYRSVLLDGGRWLFESAIRAGVRRIVLVSSCKAGFEFGRDVTEAQPPQPSTSYGRFKLAQEQLLRELAQQHDIESVILRPALVYGVGVAGNLATWLRRAKSRWLPPLPAGGARSMVSVADLSAALQLACVDPRAIGRTFYVTDGRDYLVHELDQAIRAAWGQRQSGPGPLAFWQLAAKLGTILMRGGIDAGIDQARLVALRHHSSCSSQLLRHELGWRPTQNFYQLLPEMLCSADSAC